MLRSGYRFAMKASPVAIEADAYPALHAAPARAASSASRVATGATAYRATSPAAAAAGNTFDVLPTYPAGMTTFNPYAVVSVLAEGTLMMTELEGVTGTQWLGLAPDAVIGGLEAGVTGRHSSRLSITDSRARFDIADLEAKRVHVVPLLLQIGLLTLCGTSEERGVVVVRTPNAYARQSILRLLEVAMPSVAAVVPAVVLALQQRNRAAFTEQAFAALAAVPNRMFKADPVGARKGGEREAGFHAVLLGLLLACSIPGRTHAGAEVSTQAGSSDIVVTLTAPSEQPTVWVFEVGSGAGVTLTNKMAQVKEYTEVYASTVDVTCCAVFVGPPQPASVRTIDRATGVFQIGWSHRISGSGMSAMWEEVKLYERVRPAPALLGAPLPPGGAATVAAASSASAPGSL